MPEVTINWDRAEKVFGTLLNAFSKNEYPYNVSKPPQRRENLPQNLKWGSVEHALFLFCVCYYMRGGIRSDTAILALSRLFTKCRNLFRPSYFSEFGCNKETKARMVMDNLQQEALNYKAEEIGLHWVLNFEKLERFWQGNPANFFRNAASYEDLCGIIMHQGKKSSEKANGFYGFKNKMVSMLIYFYQDAGIVNPFVFPVPVDFHVLRIMVGHGLLSVSGKDLGDDLFSQELLAAARELSSTYCLEHKVDPIHLGDSMWLLSRALCPMHPGNQTQIGKRDGRKTILRAEPVIWDNVQFLNFSKSCGQCPAASTCCYNVPAGEYYVRGRLVRRSRSSPLQLFPSHKSTA